MTLTSQILASIMQRLTEIHSRELAIEYFPEQPATYRLNHPTGSILISYSRSNFLVNDAVDATLMQRELTIPLTLVFRKLHGEFGVITYLDKIRETLTGFKPPHCEQSLKPISESFLAQNMGIWQYALDFSTITSQIQHYDYVLSEHL